VCWQKIKNTVGWGKEKNKILLGSEKKQALLQTLVCVSACSGLQMYLLFRAVA